MRAATLMALDATSRSGEERVGSKAAVRCIIEVEKRTAKKGMWGGVQKEEVGG